MNKLEKAVALEAALPDPSKVSPEEFIDKLSETMEELMLPRGRVLTAIEYESWMFPENNFTNWKAFLEKYFYLIRQTANELELLTKIYGFIANSTLQKELDKYTGDNYEMDRDRGQDSGDSMALCD